jgi:hypothetical protein
MYVSFLVICNPSFLYRTAIIKLYHFKEWTPL